MHATNARVRATAGVVSVKPRFPQKPQFGVTASLLHSVPRAPARRMVVRLVLCLCLEGAGGPGNQPNFGPLVLLSQGGEEVPKWAPSMSVVQDMCNRDAPTDDSVLVLPTTHHHHHHHHHHTHTSHPLIQHCVGCHRPRAQAQGPTGMAWGMSAAGRPDGRNQGRSAALATSGSCGASGVVPWAAGRSLESVDERVGPSSRPKDRGCGVRDGCGRDDSRVILLFGVGGRGPLIGRSCGAPGASHSLIQLRIGSSGNAGVFMPRSLSCADQDGPESPAHHFLAAAPSFTIR